MTPNPGILYFSGSGMGMPAHSGTRAQIRSLVTIGDSQLSKVLKRKFRIKMVKAIGRVISSPVINILRIRRLNEVNTWVG